MLQLRSDAYTIRNGGEGQYEFFSDISTRSLETVRIGEGAGKISVGSANAFVGYEAGKINQKGSFGAFVGFQAGGQNLNANFCTFIGAFAGKQNRNGDANTFVGFRAGELSKDGSECVGIGAYALRENVSGSRTVAVGYRAGERTLDGDFNTIVGAEAGQDNRSGNYNTMAGFRAGRAAFRGNENTYFGAYAGYSNSFGDGNAFVGYKAGEYLTIGNYNVAIGAYALQRTSTGSSNIAIGAFAGTTSTGSGNLFIGTKAGSNNTTGNDSVFLGTEAGSGADGSENVYIGKSAGCNIDGNKNVIVGAYSLMDFQTNGTVAIGYRIGETFMKGNSNVFVGNEVDTHNIYNSYGVAIGTHDVKTYHHAIALGENLNNSGLASVMIGRDIVSDAENTVSIGNDIDISSVFVLSDPLDYRNPVTQSKTYELFDVQESYSDTIYNGSQSNTSAIFAINHLNIYNSGTNRPQGLIPNFNTDLTTLFKFHLGYQGTTELILSSPTTQSDLFSYINNTSNMKKKNLESINLTTGVVEILDTYKNQNHSFGVNFYIPDNIYNEPYDPSLIGRIGVNLIRKEDTNELFYKFYFPKSYPIYQLNNVQNVILENSFDYIRQTCNMDDWQFQSNVWNYNLSSGYDIGLYENELSNLILTPPFYGSISNRVFGASNFQFYYQIYPEALFASNDTMTVSALRRLDTLHILSDTPQTINIYSSNTHLFNSNSILLHPTQPLYLDRSHILRKPLYSPNKPVSITIGQNVVVLKNNIEYSNTLLNVIYQDFIDLSLTIYPKNSNQSVSEKLLLEIDSQSYHTPIYYSTNSNLSLDYSLSNVYVTLPTSNVLTKVKLPNISIQKVYVREPPSHGLLNIPNSYTNLNEISYQSYHPYKEDLTQLLIQYTLGNRPYVKLWNIYFQRDSNSYSIPIYKLHETPLESIAQDKMTFVNTFTIPKPFYTSILDQSSVTINNGAIPGKVSYLKQYSCNIGYYQSNIGYVYRSNIQYTDSYTRVDYNSGVISDLLKTRLPPPTSWNGIACNIYYYQYTGINPIINPNNNGSYNLQSTYFYNSLQQNYYFYGQSAPYYEYEPIGLGSQHVYWQYVKQVRRTAYSKYACNIFIASCNEAHYSKSYSNLQNQDYLFQSNIPIQLFVNSTSNYTYLPSTSNTIEYSYTSNYQYTIYTNTLIPVYSLRNIDLYQKNGLYTYLPNNPYLKIIQQNIGPITYFHQSNVDQGIIYLWVSSNLPTNKPYEFHTWNLSNQRKLELNYYNNIGLNPSPSQSFAFSISNYISESIQGLSLNNFTSQQGSDIAIQSLSNAILFNSNTYEFTNKLRYPNTYYYLPLGNQPETLQTFYIQTNVNRAQTLLSQPVTYTTYLKNNIDVNTRLCDRSNILTSNHLNYINTSIPSTDLYYHITSYCNDISSTLFTQNDIDQRRIFITQSNVTSFQITYDLYNSINYLTSGFIPVQTYGQTLFPPKSMALTSCNELVHLQTIHEHNRIGPFWTYLDDTVNEDLIVHISKQPQKGYFYSSNNGLLSSNVVSRISYKDFKNHQLHYIPYQPLELSNDRYQCYLEYKGDISEIYELSLKNYWSHYSPFLLDDSRPYQNTYRINPSMIPRSDGLIQDGYTWSCNNTSLFIKNYTLPIVKEAILFTGRPYFKVSQLTEVVDISGYFNFKRLLQPSVLMSSNARDLHFFVSSNPSYGCIMNVDPNYSYLPYVSDPYFTYSDIVNNRVFYHHYGENSLTDGFKLLVGSAKLNNTDKSVVDVSPIPLEYRVQISDKSSVTLNNPDYLYKETSNDILQSSNLITTQLLNINKGNVILYSTCNLTVYQKQSSNLIPVTFFSKDQLTSNQIYYKISSNIFQNNSNINQPMRLEFIVSSNTNTIGDIDPISTLPYYNGLYLQEWQVNLNSYVSSNVIRKSLNSNQIVQYYKRTVDTSVFNFDNRRVQIDFTLNPEQQILYRDTDIGFNHSKYLKQLETLQFEFKILDQSSKYLLSAQFTHKDVTLTNYLQTSYTIPIQINMNQRNNISFIINDDRNNNNVSFYLNDKNYTTSLSLPFVLPSQSNIRTFMLQANILDPLNYYNYVLTSNISPNVYLYYNLINYPNSLKFNDFNILVNTYDVRVRENNSNEVYQFSSNLNNVIIGKLLDVKGLNNICIGQNFKTIGTDSIILGNNIGVDNTSSFGTNTLNEIFQSIVIANNSFVNSKVRDVIAIGNSILPSVNFDITDFLLKKPILIGNNIDTSLIDFHINIQNTFLKTTEAPVPGIYLGSEKDIVAIGYSNNQGFSNEYQLYVNGGISYTGALTSTGPIIHKRQIFGNQIYTSGMDHSLTIRISWTQEQLVDDNAFMVSGKFRGILTDSIHVYRRFETWVTPNNDSITSKPKGLTDFEIASYASTGIINYEHSIVRYNNTSVDLILVWTTLIELTTIEKMITHLDLEVSYPEPLGAFTMRVV